MTVTDVGRVALAARVFTIAALTSLAALAGPGYLDGALLVALTAAVATVLSLTGRLSETTVATLEGSGGRGADRAHLPRPGERGAVPGDPGR